MTKGDLVKFKTPMTDDEATAVMEVLEDRGPRLLVSDVRFADPQEWPVRPTTVVATDDVQLAYQF